jgi:hypothetical protein
MKWIVGFWLLGILSTSAQAPQKISYQAVIRNSNNVILASRSIGLKVAILKGGTVTEKVYEEIQNPVTNMNGLMSLQIGTGKVLLGEITKIKWADGIYYIKTDIDPDGGANYTISGLTELTSVPFALFAATSGSLEIESGSYNKGPKGDTGDTGLTGETGLTGATGAQGIPGVQGIAGVTGATGNTGPSGNNGGDGAAGAQGPQGLAGANGALGSQGIPGADGPVGPQGSQGLAGANGGLGLQGIPGDDGPVGPQGSQGLAGANGTLGLQGIPGAVGPVGPQGSQGPQGLAGEAGISNVAGPAGPVGLTGPQGPQGLAGADGISNVVGPTGPAGLTGPQGLSGANGSPGAAGSQGPQGPQGSPGPAGVFSGNFSGEVIFEGDFSANGPSTTIGAAGNKSGQGVRIGNGRFTFNKPNEPIQFRSDYSASAADIFDAGIFICDRQARLNFPSATDLIAELPGKKMVGDIISVMLICTAEGLTITPGEGGSLVGSDQVVPGGQRLIYIRFTDLERAAYIIY